MLAFVTGILAASVATAHFTLDFPETRGFDDDKETQFCGGFPTAATRQKFPLKGPVWINNHHTKATVDAFVSLSSDPQNFGDFNKTSNGTDIPHLTNFFQVGEGEACWNVDFTSLGLDLKNGSEVTLQVRFSGVSTALAPKFSLTMQGDGALYQCSDLVLVSDYQVPANVTCKSDAATGAGAGASNTASQSGGDHSHASSAVAPSATASKNSATAFGSSGAGAAAAAAVAIAALL